MVNLSDAIQVLYPSAINLVDFRVFDAHNGDGPSISYWNAAKLGTQPTADALDAVTATQVQAFYLNQALAQAPNTSQEITTLNILIKLAAAIVGQRLNELIQCYNADREARSLSAFTPAVDITTISATPLSITQARTDLANVLQNTTWASQ